MNKQTVIQWLKYVAIAAISFFLLLFVLGGLIFSYYAMKAPTLSEKDLVATTSSKIYDNKNNLIEVTVALYSFELSLTILAPFILLLKISTVIKQI